jgi:shikimate kinase
VAELSKRSNIVLIGMPGVGKSTIGVLLAKAANCRFIDTDVTIQAREGRSLQAIIDADGAEAFKRLEAQHIVSLDLAGHVIATGGSAVYSPEAMAHLKAGGTVVHLDLPLELVEHRITNLYTRGVVMAPGQTLRELYDERQPLYRRWADLTVDVSDKTQEQVVDAIVAALAPPA